MYLGELIATLKAVPNQNGVVPWGFGDAASYRGDYQDVAFEPLDNVTIASMLRSAEAALGATYEGYKGGQFTMDRYTECWISVYCEASREMITHTLLKYMILSVVRGDGRA